MNSKKFVSQIYCAFVFFKQKKAQILQLRNEKELTYIALKIVLNMLSWDAIQELAATE